MSLLRGAFAGALATIPMTAAMVALHRRLPRSEQQTLPPGQITARLAARAGLPLEREPRWRLTLLAHFAYGAAAGAAYAALPVRLPGPVYGAAVWLVSYAGWLPAAGLMPPPGREPARRGALMLASHLVWGAVTALASRRRR